MAVGKNTASCPADNLQLHRPPSRPTGQASRRPGHRSQQRTAVREVRTAVRGSSLVISNASNRSSLTAASAHVPISRIDNRDTRTRTRIRFDNRFFDYRLTCLSLTQVFKVQTTLKTVLLSNSRRNCATVFQPINSFPALTNDLSNMSLSIVSSAKRQLRAVKHLRSSTEKALDCC